MAQCSSCQFHNMPGATHCGRCGASLTLATATIDVHPPRATRWAKLWRRFSFRRTRLGLLSLGASFSREWWSEADADANSEPLFRMIVPGWFQLHAGRRKMGFLFLLGSLTSILMSFVYFGTVTGATWLGLVCAFHLGSIYDAIRMGARDISENLSRLAWYGFVIGCVFYLPLFAFGSHFTIPISLRQSIGPLEAGDVVVYGQYRLHQPRVGDVVVYQVREITLRPAGRAVRLQGMRLDRILAEAGQTAEFRRGQLTIDGTPSELRPLATAPIPDMAPLKIPQGHVLIVSSADLGYGVATVPELAMVSLSQIQGQVYWRHLPWSRVGFVH